MSGWPQPGAEVKLRQGGEWVGRGEVIGPASDGLLGTTTIPARWNVRIISHPMYRAGDIINFHYLDILGHMPTLPKAPQGPLVLRIRAGCTDEASRLIGQLLPLLRIEAAGVLLIPDEAHA